MASKYPWVGLALTGDSGDNWLFASERNDSVNCFALSFLIIVFCPDSTSPLLRIDWAGALPPICLLGPVA
jgi:hypothetical protein